MCRASTGGNANSGAEASPGPLSREKRIDCPPSPSAQDWGETDPVRCNKPGPTAAWRSRPRSPYMCQQTGSPAGNNLPRGVSSAALPLPWTQGLGRLHEGTHATRGSTSRPSTTPILRRRADGTCHHGCGTRSDVAVRPVPLTAPRRGRTARGEERRHAERKRRRTQRPARTDDVGPKGRVPSPSLPLTSRAGHMIHCYTSTHATQAGRMRRAHTLGRGKV